MAPGLRQALPAQPGVTAPVSALSPRLCLEAVICFKEMLASSWHCLPKHLLHSVNQRFGSNNTSGS